MSQQITETLLHKTRKGAKFDNHAILATAMNGATLHQIAKAIDMPIGGSLKRRLNWLVTKDQALVQVDRLFVTPDPVRSHQERGPVVEIVKATPRKRSARKAKKA